MVAPLELLSDLGHELDAVTIKADSQSVMQLLRNPVFSAPLQAYSMYGS